MITDSDAVFREESIGEGFKIVTVAVVEKILLLEKKWSIFDGNLKVNASVVTTFLVE